MRSLLVSILVFGSPGLLAGADKAFLRTYSGQTVDQLIALEAEYRIDSLVLAFEQGIAQRKSKKLSQVEIDVLAVEAMEREVNNGGFDQFFLNSSREFAAVLPAALERIGCPITAKIASDALTHLKIEGEITPTKVRAALLRLSKDDRTLHTMDRRYYEYKEKIADRLFAYIKKERKQISLP